MTLLAALAICAQAAESVNFRDAVSARFGREQLHFFDKLIAAKREAPSSPVKSLIESSLWVKGQQNPPPLNMTPVGLGAARA
ncbi:MAG TPA: hypothetical protein VIS73_12365, partial [Rhodocyclaceae bacterium]